MTEVAHLIDGRPTRSGERVFQTLDPATERVLADVALGDDAAVDAAVDSAWRAYREDWRPLAPAQRAGLLRALADRLEARGEEIARVESSDTGKPLAAAHGEVGGAVELLRYYATLPENVRGSTYADEPGFMTSSDRVPYGVVAAIAPWNFPIYFAVAKTAPALAAGNAVVFKSAEQTPLSTDLFARICLDAGFPAGVVNVVHGGPETGAALVGHPDVPAITFTGSTEVGRFILRAAANRIAHCHLELGGKTPFIVLEDADLEAAADTAAGAAFYNAGQICTAASRLLVAQPVLEQFTELMVERAEALRVGDPASADTDMGPLVSHEQRERVQGYVDGAVSDGARLLTGGRPPGDGPGYFLAPTVLGDVRPSMAVAREEVFGPVTAIVPVVDDDQAAAIVNDSPYGLTAAIWTADLGRALRLRDRLDVGVISVNSAGRDPAHVPYEGHKQSGVGEDKGLEAIASFTQLRVTSVAYG